MRGNIMRILALVVAYISQTAQALWPVGTWANRPNAAASIYGFYFVTDIAGGAMFRSTGTRWVPVSAFLTLAQANYQIAIGATTSQVVLSSVTLPGGLLGPNDSVFCKVMGSVSANTNSKTYRLLLGGTGIDGANLAARGESGATTVSTNFTFGFSNRNSLSLQGGEGSGASGGSSQAFQTSAVDTSIDQTLYLTGQKGNAGDTQTGEKILFYIARGVS